jgi:hypothetical protein
LSCHSICGVPSQATRALRGWPATLRTGLGATQLHSGLQQVRTELLRWMFGFWVTTFIGIAGLLIALRGS